MVYSVYYKEQDDGVSSNLQSSGSNRWWRGLVGRSDCEESMGGLKNSSMENCEKELVLIAPKPSNCVVDDLVPKEDATPFNIFHGDSKNSSNGQKLVESQGAFTLQSSPQVFGSHLELGIGQPAMVCGKYPSGDQYYDVFPAYGLQNAGRVMLPLNLSSDDGPIYVNAKQYNGIIRRRQSRAKAAMTKKVTKSHKPYKHLSRHLHAKRRPRGCGGRFLNSKETDTLKTGILNSKPTDQPTDFHRSDVLQCDRETNSSRSNMSAPEATHMFTMGDLNHFPMGNLSVASLSEMMVSGNAIHGFGMHNKWVAASAGGGIRCNLTI